MAVRPEQLKNQNPYPINHSLCISNGQNSTKLEICYERELVIWFWPVYSYTEVLSAIIVEANQ